MPAALRGGHTSRDVQECPTARIERTRLSPGGVGSGLGTSKAGKSTLSVRPLIRAAMISPQALKTRTPAKWWAQRDLNPRPSDYESPALTPELWARSIKSKKNVARVAMRGKHNSPGQGGDAGILREPDWGVLGRKRALSVIDAEVQPCPSPGISFEPQARCSIRRSVGERLTVNHENIS